MTPRELHNDTHSHPLLLLPLGRLGNMPFQCSQCDIFAAGKICTSERTKVNQYLPVATATVLCAAASRSYHRAAVASARIVIEPRCVANKFPRQRQQKFMSRAPHLLAGMIGGGQCDPKAQLHG